MDIESALRTFLADNLISVKENKNSFVSDCPSCGKEGHLYVRKSNGQSICFKCGKKWGWKGLIAIVYGCSYDDAYNVLFGKGSGEVVAGFDKFEVFPEEEEETENKLKKIILGIDFMPVKKSKKAMDYLKSRNVIDDDLIESYDIKYQAIMNAIVFPIFRNGEYYGWQARMIPPIENGRLRLITSPGFNKSKFLLNYDRSKSKENIIITEGPFDCINSDILENFGAVSSLGKTLSIDQISMIINSNASNVYIGLDKDAFEEIYRLIDYLCMYKNLYRLIPPEGKGDLGECNKEDMILAINNAESLSEANISQLEVFLK